MSTPQEILNVECPDCAAPIGEECSEWHVARARAATAHTAARRAAQELATPADARQEEADAILTELAGKVKNGTMGIDAALAHAFIAGARYVAVSES